MLSGALCAVEAWKEQLTLSQHVWIVSVAITCQVGRAGWAAVSVPRRMHSTHTSHHPSPPPTQNAAVVSCIMVSGPLCVGEASQELSTFSRHV
jgi:hypothetical protein